jgi:hypothetical protein
LPDHGRAFDVAGRGVATHEHDRGIQPCGVHAPSSIERTRDP